MAEVNFSPAARADLKEIGRFSKREFGIAVAERYVLGFDRAFDLLRMHPESGPIRSTYGAEVRCLMHHSHRILYRLGGDTVLILRMLHHSRDVTRHLGK